MKYFTYKITNTITNKAYYGWTNKDPIDKRLAVHFHSAKTGKLLIHNSIRKHGDKAFVIELINTFETKEQAMNDEIKLIAEGKTNHCRYINGGYNMTDGGEGTAGLTRTDKQLAASSRVITERNHALKGRTYEDIYGVRADEQREIRAKKTRGQKRTAQQKKDMAKRSTGNKWGCFPVEVTHTDGTVITYPSRETARKALNIKSNTTLRAIATGTYWKNGKIIKYNSPHDFTIKLLRCKL